MMTALIQKDLFVLWKQMRFYALLLVVYSVLPNSFLNFFGATFAALLPYTALAYDERAKWDRLAAMMPYSARALVMSKYAVGWGAAALNTAVCLAIQTVLRLLRPEAGYLFTPDLAVTALGVALTIIAVTMPIVFRFGVEKGRIMTILLTFSTAGAAGALANAVEKAAGAGTLRAVGAVGPWALLALAAALTAASVPLSARMYERHRERG